MADPVDYSALLDRARAGDAAAQARIQGAVAARLERFVLRNMGAALRARIEPQDVVQIVLLRLFERSSRLPADACENTLLAWTLQLAKWALADLASDRSPQEPFHSSIAAVAASKGVVTRNDEREWTRRQIDDLPTRYRDAMRLYYVEGRSARAIAVELGISENLVKQRLARGRALVRDAIGPPSEGDS